MRAYTCDITQHCWVRPEQLYATNIRQIRAIFKRARIIKDRNVYVVSDIDDSNYFQPLEKRCTLYRYYDFPELKALVFGKNKEEIDSAMLYSVEKIFCDTLPLKCFLLKIYLVFL